MAAADDKDASGDELRYWKIRRGQKILFARLQVVELTFDRVEKGEVRSVTCALVPGTKLRQQPRVAVKCAGLEPSYGGGVGMVRRSGTTSLFAARYC